MFLTFSTVALSAALSSFSRESAVAGALACSREHVFSGQLWRLLSGPLIHAGLAHALRDLSMLAIFGGLYERQSRKGLLLALVLGTALPPLVSLIFDPALRRYYGMSSAVYALASGLLLCLARQTEGRQRWLVASGALLLAVKLTVEAWTNRLLFPLSLPRGVRPLPRAHLVGAAIGATLALLRACGPSPVPTHLERDPGRSPAAE